MKMWLMTLKAKIHPELSAVVGAHLMKTPYSMGCQYVIKGLISSLSYQDVAKIIKEDLKWNIRPEKFMKTSGKFNNMLVFAVTPPPQRLV